MSRFGLEGRLAVDNTARNPKRTATTANALLIGVFLVTLVTVAGTSAEGLRRRRDQEARERRLPRQQQRRHDRRRLRRRARGDRRASRRSSPFRRESVTIDGNAVAALHRRHRARSPEIADIDVTEGSLDDLGRRHDRGGRRRRDDAWRSGSTVTVGDTPTGNVGRSLKVVAILEALASTARPGRQPRRRRRPSTSSSGDTAPTVAFIDAKPGAQSDTKDAIEDARRRSAPTSRVHGGQRRSAGSSAGSSTS